MRNTQNRAETYLCPQLNYNWLFQELARSNLAVLEVNQPRDLRKRPVLTFVVRVPHDEVAGVFFVYWLEDKPSVDAVMFESEQLNDSVVMSIDPYYNQANADTSTREIGYTAAFYWNDGEMPAVVAQDDCTVTLIRNGQKVSNNVGIELHPNLTKGLEGVGTSNAK